jgi:hypothetical protein
MTESEMREAEERAEAAWRERDAVVHRTHFVMDVAGAHALHDELDRSAEWMEFKSQMEFESFGNEGFDRRMRRVMLGVSMFVFFNFAIDTDMTLWVEQVLFDAILRLHAAGGKLYTVWLDPEENDRRLEAERAIADASGPPPV